MTILKSQDNLLKKMVLKKIINKKLQINLQEKSRRFKSFARRTFFSVQLIEIHNTSFFKIIITMGRKYAKIMKTTNKTTGDFHREIAHNNGFQ